MLDILTLEVNGSQQLKPNCGSEQALLGVSGFRAKVVFA